MYFNPQPHRCLRCGHIFTHLQGDLIFNLCPQVPQMRLPPDYGSILHMTIQESNVYRPAHTAFKHRDGVANAINIKTHFS